MQVKHLLTCLLIARVAAADDASVTATATPPSRDDLDLRLTMSSFMYRQSGSDPGALVTEGAQPQNASPVRRFFGDLRMELSDEGLVVDARVRQTTSERYQSGADGGGEYEVRTLAYRLGPVMLGRQFIDAVGATKIDGVSLTQPLTAEAKAVAFAGAFPVLGSRSVDTDYLHAKNIDGTDGSLIIPVSGGLGLSYEGPSMHGDIGAAGVYAPQDVPDAPPEQKTRVFTTTSGYWRAGSGFDAYHFVLLDVAPSVRLTNGSLGIDARPTENVQLTAAVNHVSTDLLQIAARNTLVDPDPTAIGIVQNNIRLLTISQDLARAGASIAMAERRFELSLAGTLHRRPSVAVPTADGTMSVVFPEARSADATLGIVDRRSIGGLRLAASGSVIEPLGTTYPNRSRGVIVRASGARAFADLRGSLEADVMYEHLKDSGANASCTTSTDPLACYGTSSTTAAQAGVLVSWRVAREWLLIADTHVGYQTVGSHYLAPMNGDPMAPLVDTPVAWPTVVSVTAFARVQWRYR